jgi:hypothetical protein
LPGTAAAAVLFGLLMLTGKSLPLCIGMHVGFNLAALWTGIRVWQTPLPLVALPPPLLALAGLGAVIAYGYAFGMRGRRAGPIAPLLASAAAIPTEDASDRGSL